MRLTTPDAFIRFVGNDLHPTDYTRIDEWVNRIHEWKNAGIRSVYFFMHQNEEVHSPEAARYLIQQLNKVCGLSIPEPEFVAASEEGPVVKVARTKKAPAKKTTAKKKS
jgi:uncharacterized protein YecE (DUF72 family)